LARRGRRKPVLLSSPERDDACDHAIEGGREVTIVASKPEKERGAVALIKNQETTAFHTLGHRQETGHRGKQNGYLPENDE